MEWSDGASEGTDVKSTGESGTTKFLRVDGDGTCSWQVPPDTNTQVGGATGVDFDDNVKARFGTGDDLEIYHNGVQSVIDGKYHPIEIRHQSEVHIKCVDDGAVELYENNTKRLETTSSGINVTGQINVNGAALSAAPEISGTASGSIAQDKACIVKTDGNIAQVLKSTTQQNPALADSAEFIAAGNYYQGNAQIKYISELDCYICAYWYRQNNSNNKYRIKVGIDGTGSDLGKIIWSTNEGTTMNDSNFQTSPRFGYDPNSGHLILLVPYNSGSHSRIRSATVTVDRDNVNNSVVTYANQMTFNQYQNYGPVDVVHDYTSGKTVAFFNSAARVIEVNSSTGALNWASGSSAVGLDDENHSAASLNIKYIPEVGKICYGYIDAAANEGSESLKFNTLNISSGNAITRNTRVTLTDGVNNSSNGQPENCIGFSWTYDKSISRFVIVYMIHDGTHFGKTSFRVGSNSSGNVTWTNRATLIDYSGNGDHSNYTSSQQQLAYDENAGKLSFVYVHPGNTNKCKSFTWNATTSGGTANVGTATLLINSNMTIHGLFYRSAIAGCIFWDRQNSNNTAGKSHSITNAISTTNLTTENFVGFAKAAATNGNSVNIKVVGNTSTQSSLTAGSKHYVQMDGTLGTTADTPSVEAGLALSSTKLLIK